MHELLVLPGQLALHGYKASHQEAKEANASHGPVDKYTLYHINNIIVCTESAAKG